MGSDSDIRVDYDLHGIRLATWAGREDVRQALDRRLARHRVNASVAPHLRLRFLSDMVDASVRDPDGAWRTVYEPVSGTVRHHPEADILSAQVSGVRMYADLRAGIGFIAGGKWGATQLYAAVHTLTTIVLMEALKRHARFALHAACLSRDGRAVLIAGASGAGKTTLALALALAGLDFLSDDLVFLQPRGNGPVRVLGFADAVGITTETQRLLPELCAGSDRAAEPGFPKRLHRMEDLVATRIVTAGEPFAVVFPDTTGSQRGRLEPLDPGDALLRLVPDVLLTDAARSRAHLAAIADLTGQVSCHRLVRCRDLHASARLVCSLL